MRGPVKARAVQIHPANGGYVVIVGCQTFVYGADEVTDLVDNLETYLVSPEAVEKEWMAAHSNLLEGAVPIVGVGISGYNR